MRMLEGKVAVVTGGSRGIGRAIADRFGTEGADLLLVALHDEGLERATEELRGQGVRVDAVAGDIASPALAHRVAEFASHTHGRVDVLVNCAGMISRTPFGALSDEEWHRVIDVNLHGTYYMSRALLPGMAERRSGKVINVTSQMARIPHPNASPSYEVSKAGMAALTRHLAYHFAQYGICVNAIAPGSIDTDLPKSMSDEARERLRAAIPLRRLGEPSEVGALAAFLASSEADYITGATITISGGSLMDW